MSKGLFRVTCQHMNHDSSWERWGVLSTFSGILQTHPWTMCVPPWYTNEFFNSILWVKKGRDVSWTPTLRKTSTERSPENDGFLQYLSQISLNCTFIAGIIQWRFFALIFFFKFHPRTMTPPRPIGFPELAKASWERSLFPLKVGCPWERFPPPMCIEFSLLGCPGDHFGDFCLISWTSPWNIEKQTLAIIGPPNNGRLEINNWAKYYLVWNSNK